MQQTIDKLKDLVLSIKGGGAIPIVAEYRKGKGYHDVLNLKRRVSLEKSEAEPMILVL